MTACPAPRYTGRPAQTDVLSIPPSIKFPAKIPLIEDMESKVRKRICQYDLLDKLGEGNNGVVYKAYDTGHRRIVTLKAVSTETACSPLFRRRTLPGLKEIARLNHANVAAVVDVIEHEGATIIVGEYLSGSTLQELLSSGPIPEDRFLRIAGGVANGLHAAHQKHVVHGDLQPSNVMVLPGDRTKILDFGFPRRLSQEYDLTSDYPLDTYPYLSPEEIRGESPGPASDLFTLGIIFYELLTGVRPFSANHRTALVRSILGDVPNMKLVHRNGASGETALLLGRLMAKNKEERCVDTRELIVTLDTIGSTLKRRPATPSVANKLNSPRPYLLIPVLAIILVILWAIAAAYR